MAIALVSSLMLVILGETGVIEVHRYAHFVPSIDFSDLVFLGFLAFLLFAGALHVDLGDLYKVKWTVTILSTLGTIISTFVIGALFWCAAYSLGYDLRFIYALLFGALISPTDPIAVLGIIKKAGAPKDLETRITGESLFNDGVGAVIFLTILDIATGRSEPSVASVSWFFVQETVGGIALGWLSSVGWCFACFARSTITRWRFCFLSRCAWDLMRLPKRFICRDRSRWSSPIHCSTVGYGRSTVCRRAPIIPGWRPNRRSDASGVPRAFCA
jgi:NhaP-type Na+/H+ or K+/H+ antiporter